MTDFRARVNAQYFGDPLASGEATVSYILGVVLHLVLALATQSIVPVLVLLFLLVVGLAVSLLPVKKTAWHYFEFTIIALQLVILSVLSPEAYVGIVFFSAVHMYRANYTFGAQRGSLLSAPMIVALASAYGLHYSNAAAVISPATAAMVLLGYVLLIAISYAESVSMGSVLQRVATDNSSSSNLLSSIDAILENVGEALIGVDADLRVMFVNSRALDALGIESKADILGGLASRLGVFLDQDGSPIAADLDPFYLAYSSKATISYRISTVNRVFVRDESGAVVPAGLRVSPIINNEGQLQGVVAVLQDLSGINDVDKGKSDFVALASHHLRTPINAVRWHLERLMKKDTDNLSDKQKSTLEIISQSNARILALINNLLSVSRVETGTLHIAAEEVDVAKMLRTAQDALSDTRHKTNAKLEVMIDSSLPKLQKSDSYAVRVIFDNLLTNALQYSPDGNVKVRLRSVQPAEYARIVNGQSLVTPTGGILLEVSDDGIGIPSNQQKNMFEKMFRADNAREIYADGTGLGLYLSRQLVAAVGGKIWFSSKMKLGSTFSVFLPIEPPDSPANKQV